jgi:hypothetical protein
MVVLKTVGSAICLPAAESCRHAEVYVFSDCHNLFFHTGKNTECQFHTFYTTGSNCFNAVVRSFTSFTKVSTGFTKVSTGFTKVSTGFTKVSTGFTKVSTGFTGKQAEVKMNRSVENI